jgi:futalosine hydrolase
MKILLVSATPTESAELRDQLDLPLLGVGKLASGKLGDLEINLLHTGIGMVNTAWHLGRTLLLDRPDVAVQFGIGGAFPHGPDLEEVVEIVSECYAELGADSPQGQISLKEMGFAHFEHAGNAYFNEIAQPRAALVGIRACRAVTLNLVSGTMKGIERLQQIWNPEVESMEGAAFFQGCILEGIPFREFRAISNRVEPRNRSAWKMKEAITASQRHILNLLHDVQRNLLEL